MLTNERLASPPSGVQFREAGFTFFRPGLSVFKGEEWERGQSREQCIKSLPRYGQATDRLTGSASWRSVTPPPSRSAAGIDGGDAMMTALAPPFSFPRLLFDVGNLLLEFLAHGSPLAVDATPSRPC